MNSCETLDREQLANHQFARLQALLGPVLASNAFYRAKFKAVGVSCPEDIPDFAAFSRLPMTTRAELSADQVEIPPYGPNLTCPAAQDTRNPQTSGTTGQP